MKRCIIILISVFLIFSITGCGNKEQNVKENVVEEAKDTEQNEYQRDTLFAHIGLEQENYELISGITTNNCLSQWWYKTTDNDGVYIAIGDIRKNEGRGFPEIGDEIKSISNSDDFILEITIGKITEDGYLDYEHESRSYYFIQRGKDIAFVSLVVND